MEKITYQPLIQYLSEQEGFYNQLLREFELKHGIPDANFITDWIVNVIEPVLEEITGAYPHRLPQLFQAMFTELLFLAANRNVIEYKDEYRKAWALCVKIPGVFQAYPSRLIKAIDSAVDSIRDYHPNKVFQWISQMDQVAAECHTLEQFLACGRILAWSCGMAHLRVRAESEFSNLPPGLKKTIQQAAGISSNPETFFSHEWGTLSKHDFMGEAGGFTGFGGNFASPPLVIQMEDKIIATDRKSCFLLFADSFGKVLLNCPPIPEDIILDKANTKGLETARKRFGKVFDFGDVTSFVAIDHTLVITRASSHYLYIYGCPVEP